MLKKARAEEMSGTARRCHMNGLQIRVWSGRSSPHSDHCQHAPQHVNCQKHVFFFSTRFFSITAQHAQNTLQLPQLIERSAFVRSRRNGSSTADPACQKFDWAFQNCDRALFF